LLLGWFLCWGSLLCCSFGPLTFCLMLHCCEDFAGTQGLIFNASKLSPFALVPSPLRPTLPTFTSLMLHLWCILVFSYVSCKSNCIMVKYHSHTIPLQLVNRSIIAVYALARLLLFEECVLGVFCRTCSKAVPPTTRKAPFSADGTIISVIHFLHVAKVTRLFSF